MPQPALRIDWLCDWCGGVLIVDDGCPCRQPHDPVGVRRRHREAVQRARRTDAAMRPRRWAA